MNSIGLDTRHSLSFKNLRFKNRQFKRTIHDVELHRKQLKASTIFCLHIEKNAQFFFLISEISLVNFLRFFCISDLEMLCDSLNLDTDLVLRGLIKYQLTFVTICQRMSRCRRAICVKRTLPNLLK